MGDNLLKKEFTSKDVNRARNLIKGSAHEKTQSSVGYKKHKDYRKEGEEWEENGRKWVIKDGIKQNIPKIKKSSQPLFCPLCNKLMKEKDLILYRQHKRCLDCQVIFETNLKTQGKWEEYKNSIINDDVDNFIKDYCLWFEEEIQKENSSIYITEYGDKEEWKGSLKKKLLEEKQKTLDFLNNLKK